MRQLVMPAFENYTLREIDVRKIEPHALRPLEQRRNPIEPGLDRNQHPRRQIAIQPQEEEPEETLAAIQKFAAAR